MSLLRRFLDKQEKHFEKGGKLERLYPVFEVIDTFLYTPGTVTKRPAHVRDVIDLKRVMMWVVYALIPPVFMALYNTGLQANLAIAKLGMPSIEGWRGTVITAIGAGFNPLSILDCMLHGALYFFPVYIVCLIAGFLWEAVFAVIRQRQMNEMFLVTTLIFSLIVPPTIPLWQVALGISFGIVMGSHIYGGFGRNVFNPVLIGYAFLFFAYPAQITGDTVWVAVDGITKATPLAELEDPALALSASWIDAFLGIIPGSMGETSALACLIGAAILLITGIASWRIMFSIAAGMVVLSLLFNMIGSETNPMFHVTPLWHFVLGSFAFGTVFIATDPITSAATKGGQYLYGLLIGVLIVLVRVVNPAYTEGVMLAILFGNIFAHAIDKIIVNRNVKRRQIGYAR